MTKPALSVWHALCHSEPGASHNLAGTACQDDSRHIDLDGGTIRLAAVADGHGSRAHFRSAQGAKMAVDVALNELGIFFKDICAIDSETGAIREAAGKLPKSIVQKWREAVAADAAENPFSADEQTTLREQSGGLVEVAYGTTLIVAGAGPRHVILLQLGDGDTQWVSAQGEVSRPLPEDPLLSGPATTSLCNDGAENYMRVEVISLDAGLPKLIMLSTDGYANSFAAEDFPAVAKSYADAIAEHGAASVQRQLPAWLSKTSADGSSDDISIALIWPDANRMGQAIGREEAAASPETEPRAPVGDAATQSAFSATSAAVIEEAPAMAQAVPLRKISVWLVALLGTAFGASLTLAAMLFVKPLLWQTFEQSHLQSSGQKEAAPASHQKAVQTTSQPSPLSRPALVLPLGRPPTSAATSPTLLTSPPLPPIERKTVPQSVRPTFQLGG